VWLRHAFFKQERRLRPNYLSSEICPLARAVEFIKVNIMKIAGQARIEHNMLEIAFAPEAVYIPAGNGYPGGLFDTDLNPIRQALSRRGNDIRLSRPITDDIDFSALPLIQSDRPYFFIGEINPHFGHFLLESTARLWPLLHLTPGFAGKYLFFSQKASSALLEKTFIKDIFGSLSLEPKNFTVYRKPCRLQNVFIAPPAFEIRSQGCPVFRQTMQAIGNTLANGLSEINNTKLTPLYLSKSKLAKGVSGIINEADIEDSLRKKGVDIWHPETVDLASQIKEISSRKYLIGSVGSAFHNLLFCPGDKIISGVVLGEKVNSNYIIIDKLCGNMGKYEPGTALGITLSTDANLCAKSGFMRTFYADEPDHVAETLLRNISR
jgi:hypothetical protein